MAARPRPVSRRRFLLGATAALLAGCEGARLPALERGPIAAMFPGHIDDGWITEAGYRGLERVRDQLGIPVRHLAGIAPEEEAMKAALRELARSDATMVVSYGARTSAAAQRVAWEFPEQRFSVIQGELARPNVALYGVLQEQSAWLAGAAAGLLTRTNVVGHVSGARTPLALGARAGFAAGLAHTNPRARLLSHFSDAAEDPGAARRVAIAEIDAGADLLFSLLGAGRSGVVAAARERGVKQIGAVLDWVTAEPDAFVASAVADPGVALFQSARDLYDNLWKGDLVKRLGVRTPSAVRLALAADVPEPVRARIGVLTGQLAARTIVVPERYDGPEFTPA